MECLRKEEQTMPQMTYPNQRMIKIHRERASVDFLGIKNENWQAASRDLGAHALQLYLYLAANANNYTLALSPAAIRQDIGMARSTYSLTQALPLKMFRNVSVTQI